MSDWKELLLGQVINLKRGYDLPKRLREEGEVPIYSSSGISGCNERAKVQPLGVVTGRYGTIGKIFLAKTPFWPLNTTLYVQDFKGNDPVFIYYFLKQVNWEQFNDKSAVPGINRNDVHQEIVKIPEREEQEAIAAVLSSLDDKIDLLHRQNKTLEAMAQTLFRHWFVDGASAEWEEGTLGDVIYIYDKQRIPLSKMERNKMKDGDLYPYYGAASIMDYVNDYIFDGEYILMGEDGTVKTDDGYPILQYATEKFWINNHAHILQAKKPYSNFLIWCYLKQKNINEIVTGAVQPKINQRNLKSLEFPIPPLELVEEFITVTEPMFAKVKANNNQIRTLEKLRDTLLPKLMSGAVRVKF